MKKGGAFFQPNPASSSAAGQVRRPDLISSTTVDFIHDSGFHLRSRFHPCESFPRISFYRRLCCRSKPGRDEEFREQVSGGSIRAAGSAAKGIGNRRFVKRSYGCKKMRRYRGLKFLSCFLSFTFLSLLLSSVQVQTCIIKYKKNIYIYNINIK